VLAEDGSKMSKSKRNYPDPWEVLGKYGADSLRLYLMHSPVMQAEDLNFSVRELEALHRKVVLILWNVRNYFITYVREVDHLRQPGCLILDQWVQARTKELVNGVTDYMDAYNTVRASRVIEEYVTDLSTWYVRRSRGRKDSAFFETLHGALLTVSNVTAPVMPYLAEHIYQSLRSFADTKGSTLEGSLRSNLGELEESVHLADWPKTVKLSKDESKLLADMALVRDVASKALALRKAQNIALKQPLASLKVKTLNLKPELQAILAEEVNVKRVEVDAKLTEDVALDTTMTDELKLEGFVRGLERTIQELRKQQRFRVGEQAALFYETADAELEAAMQEVDRKKTYLKSIERGGKEGATRHALEGKDISLLLERSV
jgi:isoleucyl-tRNA synthetase